MVTVADAHRNGVVAAAVPAATTSASAEPVPTGSMSAAIHAVQLARKALNDQSAALLAGDRVKFLAPAGPDNPAVAAELGRRFDSLRALRVSSYQQTVERATHEHDDATEPWYTSIWVTYCLGTECEVSDAHLDGYWTEVPGGIRLTGLRTTPGSSSQPRPWEVDTVQALAGTRAVVATGPGYAGRLPELLARTERAAAIADRFPVGATNPHGYVVYFADSTQKTRWLGGFSAQGVVGTTYPTGNRAMEVVIDLAGVGTSELDFVIAHELGHVVTLRNARTSPPDWLSEGIADYVASAGQPAARYPGRSVVARYLRETRWDGALERTFAGTDLPTWKIVAEYGLGYYCVRAMSDRYGEPAMLAFFNHVAVDVGGGGLDAAARAAYQTGWAEVQQQCLTYTRAAVR